MLQCNITQTLNVNAECGWDIATQYGTVQVSMLTGDKLSRLTD